MLANFGNARLCRLDPGTLSAHLLVDGHEMGLADMGNCVVDDEGSPGTQVRQRSPGTIPPEPIRSGSTCR